MALWTQPRWLRSPGAGVAISEHRRDEQPRLGSLGGIRPAQRDCSDEASGGARRSQISAPPLSLDPASHPMAVNTSSNVAAACLAYISTRPAQTARRTPAARPVVRDPRDRRNPALARLDRPQPRSQSSRTVKDSPRPAHPRLARARRALEDASYREIAGALFGAGGCPSAAGKVTICATARYASSISALT